MASLCWMLLLLFSCSSLSHASFLVDTEKEALLELRKILEYPRSLANLSAQMDLCGLQLAMAFSVACEGGHVTHLQITGGSTSSEGRRKDEMLSSSFSLESLILHLATFSRLKVLHLSFLGLWGPLPSKIGRLSYLEALNMSSNFLWGVLPNRLFSLKNLKVLALDDNMLNASLPQKWSSLPNLCVLSLASNMIYGELPSDFFTQLQSLQGLYLDRNLFSGRLPMSLSNASNIQALSLSQNAFYGNLPDLRSLTNLIALNLQDNQIGPAFPSLPSQLLYATLRKNNLQGPISSSITRLQQMQQLDLSSNLLSGVLPPAFFTLARIEYLSVARNRLSGSLPSTLTLSSSVTMIDLSFNLFTGYFPAQLVALAKRSAIKAEWNCLSTSLQPQNPFSYCQNGARATVVDPQITTARNDKTADSRIGILLGITGSIVAVALASLAVLFALFYRKRSLSGGSRSPRSNGVGMCMGSKSICVSTELLARARYISRTLKLGPLGLPHFRMFSMDEIFKATDYFHESFLIGQGSQGKVYKGQLDDGLVVAIKCLRKERVRCAKNVAIRIERLAKFRHPNLVTLLGYTLATDDAGGNQEDVHVYIIYEYLHSRTLQMKIASKSQNGFGWLQRLLAIIGAAKGIHYLHCGVFPGVFDNNINIRNILLDQNLSSKVSDFGLASPLDTAEDGDGKSFLTNGLSSVEGSRIKLLEKKDVYNFGLVLLQVLVGKSLASMNTVNRGKLMESFMTDQMSRLELIDPRIRGACNVESLETIAEITANCLAEDVIVRPSMEDVLWNLRYALQVQESSNGGSQEDIGELLQRLDVHALKGRNNVGSVGKTRAENLGKPSSPNAEFFR